MRDDFSEGVKRILAERVGYRCSHPDCGASTTGPHTEAGKRVLVGVAAHITAASEDGPRYNPELTEEERKAPENGIWMCQTHGTLVDRDEKRYPESLLREWKAKAESEAERAIGKTVGWAPAEERVVLSEKLRASRPEPDPETMALDLLWKHWKAYMRVVQLIDDIGHLEHNNIVNIARPPSYIAERRKLVARFNEDYSAMQQDFERAVALLEAVRDASVGEPNIQALEAIISAVKEIATTIEAMVAWTEDKHNEPVGLGMLHQRPKVCDDARAANKLMNDLVAKRRTARSGS